MKKQNSMGPWVMALKRFKKNKIALIGAFFLLVVILATLLVPVFSPHPLTDINVVMRYKAPQISHPFGTDQFGQDLFTRVMYGGRLSLILSAFSAVITITIGTLIGALSGYFGGWLDQLLMRLTELVHVLPLIPVLIAFTAIFNMGLPPLERMIVTMGIYGFLNFPSLARLVRGQIMVHKKSEFMNAADLLGLSKTSKIFRHLMPNIFGVIIASSAGIIANALLIELMLSFVGLGFPPPTPTWGNLIPNIRSSGISAYYWMWFFPVTLISLTVISINLMGEGLRLALDPKEEGR
ncbi:ABC transporter permease [Fusibacter tunisiensis]|uniref:Peptide/nickel transport system permease protein n=1 Tax=Fusibacter tunisiensis TaxID=1008308 RepID=A0ABS2MMR5_9FIRM|nr:ABC transporter permease [Fusibacter tunisiensis]MBM7560692.1 peptide/nickel transport system permease protein [Fusibacter tunisiensis]